MKIIRTAGFIDNLKEAKKNKKNPCWKNYEMVGMKKKKGREVPNCVPKKAQSKLQTAWLDGDVLGYDKNTAIEVKYEAFPLSPQDYDRSIQSHVAIDEIKLPNGKILKSDNRLGSADEQLPSEWFDSFWSALADHIDESRIPYDPYDDPTGQELDKMYNPYDSEQELRHPEY